MIYPVGSAPHAIEIAKGEIGYVETPDNITKFGEFTKANGLPCRCSQIQGDWSLA
jgi:hypothetical protein